MRPKTKKTKPQYGNNFDEDTQRRRKLKPRKKEKYKKIAQDDDYDDII